MFKLGDTAYIGTTHVRIIGIEYKEINTSSSKHVIILVGMEAGELNNVVAYWVRSRDGIQRAQPDGLSRVMAMPVRISRAV